MKSSQNGERWNITVFASQLMFCVGALISLALVSFIDKDYLVLTFSTSFLLLFFWLMVIGLKGGFNEDY